MNNNKNKNTTSNNNEAKNTIKKPLSFLLLHNLKFTFAFSLLVLLIAYFILVINTSSSSLSYIKNFVPLSFIKRDISNSNQNIQTDMASADESWKDAKSIYEFKAKDINGNEIELSKYQGRVVLIVNVACNCGFTAGNYPEMQELHKKYEKDGLSVLAFPCNQFGGQEPKPEAEIKEFVKQFNVEFDMFSKINVNGENAHPLYKYLKSKVDGTLGNFIKWNFSKFLVDRAGIPVKRYSPTTKPLEIEEDILKLLGGKKL